MQMLALDVLGEPAAAGTLDDVRLSTLQDLAPVVLSGLYDQARHRTSMTTASFRLDAVLHRVVAAFGAP